MHARHFNQANLIDGVSNLQYQEWLLPVLEKLPGQKRTCTSIGPDSITPDSIWVSETTTDRENTFTNLKSIAKYRFRVIAVGKGKQAEYSLPVSVVIQ